VDEMVAAPGIQAGAEHALKKVVKLYHRIAPPPHRELATPRLRCCYYSISDCCSLMNRYNPRTKALLFCFPPTRDAPRTNTLH